MAELRNDYKDDVLNTDVNSQRKYRMIDNNDGTVSFMDVTEYSQVGDEFGAAILNTIATMLGGVTIVVTTQEKYNSLPTPRPPKTLYLIPKE